VQPIIEHVILTAGNQIYVYGYLLNSSYRGTHPSDGGQQVGDPYSVIPAVGLPCRDHEQGRLKH